MLLRPPRPTRTDTPFPYTTLFRSPWHRLFVIVAAIGLMLALTWLLRRTMFGWAVRAVAQDREAASLQGISIGKVSIAAMMLSAGLAGSAGSLMAPIVRVGPSSEERRVGNVCVRTGRSRGSPCN